MSEYFNAKRARLDPSFFAGTQRYCSAFEAESVFDGQIQLQSFEVNRVFSVQPDIIDKIGDIRIEVLGGRRVLPDYLSDSVSSIRNSISLALTLARW